VGAPAPPGHEVHPPAKGRVNFRPVYAGRLRLEVYLDVILRATTKKGRQLFLEKSAPPDKILATPMDTAIIKWNSHKVHVLLKLVMVTTIITH